MAKKLTEKKKTAPAARGTVSIGGEAAAVLAEGEVRNLGTLAPGGYIWRPKGGAQVLVLKGEEKCILGELGAQENGLAPGEVCIRSAGGAAIYLRNSGKIELRGAVFVNGEELK